MTLARLVILNPSTVTLSNAKSLRTSSVKDLWQNDPRPAPNQAAQPTADSRLRLGGRADRSLLAEHLVDPDGLCPALHRDKADPLRFE